MLEGQKGDQGRRERNIAGWDKFSILNRVALIGSLLTKAL